MKELLSLDGWMREKDLSQDYILAALTYQDSIAMAELIFSSSTADVKKRVFGSSPYNCVNWKLADYFPLETARGDLLAFPLPLLDILLQY